MKEQVKKFFPILIAALGVVFAVAVYFTGTVGTGNGLYSELGAAITGITGDRVISNVQAAESTVPVEVPGIKYNAGAKTVGDAAGIRELFLFSYSDGRMVSGADEESIVIYLMDIEDSTQGSVLEKYTTEEIGAMEEVSAPFIYDVQKNILYFHKRGSFKMKIKVYYDANTSVEYEFLFPVEAR